MIMELTLNKLIEIAKEMDINFDMPILWQKSDRGTDYVELGISDYSEQKGKGRLRYVGTISKGCGCFYPSSM